MFLGVHDLFVQERGRRIVFSDKFFVHEKYVGTLHTLKFDLGLVRLPIEVQYTGEEVLRTCNVTYDFILSSCRPN